MNRFFGFLISICCALFVFTSCQKEMSNEFGTLLVAEGSLQDSTGNCLPSSVHGTFYTGVTPGKDTAYVEIQVNVTQTGSYNITSDFQDGLQFLDSGFFSNTGLNVVRLKPIGTPIIPGTSTYNINFDSSFCSFTVTVEDSTGRDYGGGIDTTGGGDTSQVQGGQWQFKDGSNIIAGTFNSAIKDNSLGTATSLNLTGVTSTGDTSLSLQFIIAASDVQPGTYTTISNGIFFNVAQISPTFLSLYTADALTAGSDITLVITSYDSATKEMKGTFTGNMETSPGNIVPITNGLIDVIFP